MYFSNFDNVKKEFKKQKMLEKIENLCSIFLIYIIII